MTNDSTSRDVRTLSVEARHLLHDARSCNSSQRAKIGVRMPELCNADSGAAPHGNMIPLGRTTGILRATVRLLMATLVVAGFAGLAALALPIVVLRSVLGDGGRRQWRVGVRAPAMESLLPGRLVPFPRPRAISHPTAT